MRLALKGLEKWLLKDGLKVYFFMHCPEEQHSPANARALQRILQQRALAVLALLCGAAALALDADLAVLAPSAHAYSSQVHQG